MDSRSSGRTALHWMFLALGVLSILFPELVVHWVLRADSWARVISRHDKTLYIPFLQAAHFYLVPQALLCVCAAWWLKRGKVWAQWTACAASCILLLGFPFFTVFGVLGLYGLFTKPQEKKAPKPAKSRATPPRKPLEQESLGGPFLFGVGMFCAFQAFAFLCMYAQRAGLPAWNPGWKGLLYLAGFMLLYPALHELGHAAIAWTVFFRVTAIAIGPVRFSSDGYAYRADFDWKHFWANDGYVRAVPVSDENLLLKYVAITLAGPLVSLIAGLLLLLAFFTIPGSGWERWWWVVACNAVLGIFDAVVNLLPVGHADGSILYHLLRGTSEGDRLLHSAKLSMLWEQAAACHSSADFEGEMELRRLILEAADQDGISMELASAHQALGYALLACEDWASAESELRKSLELSNSRSDLVGIQKACLERGNLSEAAKAGAAALIGRTRAHRKGVNLATSHLIEAQVHLRAGAFDQASGSANAAISLLGAGQGPAILRATAYAVEAQAQFAMGSAEEGLAAASKAADIPGSREVPPADRNLAFAVLGDLGDALWKFGESEMAVDLMRQAVNTLDATGARTAAARYRIKLAGALRSLGREAEAVYTLPDEESLPAVLRRALVAERGEMQLASGHLAEAIAELQKLAKLWRAEPGSQPIEVAVADALLARALLEAGDAEQAGVLARGAIGVLEPIEHPDAAGCRITLALARRERSRAVFDAALQIIESAPLLGKGEKARRLDFERARVERLGPVEGSAEWQESTRTELVPWAGALG